MVGRAREDLRGRRRVAGGNVWFSQGGLNRRPHVPHCTGTNPEPQSALSKRPRQTCPDLGKDREARGQGSKRPGGHVTMKLQSRLG